MELEKEYTEEDVKVFEAKATLAHFDNTHFNKVDEFMLYVNNPVRVIDDQNKIIGHATVFWDEGVLKTSLYFEYSCPERLSVEVGDPVYAHALGSIALQDDTVVLPLWSPEAKLTISSVNVGAIKLSKTPVADSRAGLLTKA